VIYQCGGLWKVEREEKQVEMDVCFLAVGSARCSEPNFAKIGDGYFIKRCPKKDKNHRRSNAEKLF